MNGQCPYCHDDQRHHYAPPPRRNSDDSFHEQPPGYPSRRSILKKELIHFCKNTTIRGIPRIVKAKSERNRWVWCVSVLMLFLCGFVCLWFLAKQYFTYDVIHPPRVLRDANAPFPALTVCNLRPLSRSGKNFLMEHDLKDPRSYGLSVNTYGKNEYYYKKNLTYYYKLTAFMSLAGYLESLPNFVREENYEMLGHNRTNLIVHCSVLYLKNNTATRITKKCDHAGFWKHNVHATFLNCYTFNLRPEYRGSAKSVEIFMYLDEDLNATQCVDCFSQDAKTQQSGAAIHIHNANTYPNLNQELINLMPGTLTEIKVKSYQNIQKKPPYGRCSPDTPKNILLHNLTYAYSEYACRLSTIQKEINDACLCSAIEFPIQNLTLPYCSELPHFIYKNRCLSSTSAPSSSSKPASNSSSGPAPNSSPASAANISMERCKQDVEMSLHRQTCKVRVMQKYEKDIVPTCTLHCSFFSYDSDRSTSIWPSKAFQTTWLNTRVGRTIRGKPEMYPYRQAQEYLRQGNHKKAWEIMQKTNVLEKNLVGVFVNRPNFNLHIVEEKEVLSLTSFLSQVGGLLSIFIGLTFIFVVEISEFFLNCAMALCCSQPDKKPPNREPRSDTALARPLREAYFEEPQASGDVGFRSFACAHRTDTHILECRHCTAARRGEAAL